MKNRTREIRTSGSVRDEDGQHPHLLGRRQFLQLAASATLLPCVPRIAQAQSYPTRPVRWIVPFPPGGIADVVVRLIGQYLTEKLGQPFVIENRPGAASNLGTEMVVRAPSDGYTLLFVGQPSAVNATLYPKLNFHFVSDIAPVAGMARTPTVLVVNPSLPVRTVSELIAYAKAHPGKMNFASSGKGSTSHMAGELFKIMAGVDIVHVPYRGSAPALTDLLGGQVQIVFDNITTSIPHIQSGGLRALAVTSAVRSPALPDIPPLEDFVPGFEVGAWAGVGAPKGTPAEIVERLNRAINAAIADGLIKARLAELGATVLPGTAADFGKLIVEETEKWRNVIRVAQIELE
jgi:tripartite-type tricarboxylate transporter receptor subunit TctC